MEAIRNLNFRIWVLAATCHCDHTQSGSPS